MKKFALYLSMVAFLTSLVACEGKAWDADEELKKISIDWAGDYIDYILDNLTVDRIDSLSSYSKKQHIYITTDYKDTLRREIHFVKSKDERSDSADVVSTLVQYGDTVIVTTDGYRYSNKFYAHLYTVDPGIVNYDGEFRIDFFEMGKSTPWTSSVIRYRQAHDKDAYYPYYMDEPRLQ